MRPMIADSYLRCGWRDELLALRKVHVRFVGTRGAALGMRRRRGTRRSDARPATTRDDLDVGSRRELIARVRLRVRVPIRRQLAAEHEPAPFAHSRTAAANRTLFLNAAVDVNATPRAAATPPSAAPSRGVARPRRRRRRPA